MDHKVYDIWNTLTEEKISPDGRWVLWSEGPDEKDRKLVVVPVEKRKGYSIASGVAGKFSPESNFVVSMAEPSKRELKKFRLKKKKDKAAQAPMNSAVVLNLKNGGIRRFERVKSFILPEDKGEFLAILHEPEEEKASKKGMADFVLKKEKNESDSKKSCRMTFMNMTSGDVSTYERVLDFDFSRDGEWLVFIVIHYSGEDVSKNGVYALETKTGKIFSLMKGEGDYSKIAISRQSDRVAFLSNRDDLDTDESFYSLYHWGVGERSAKLLAKKKIEGLPKGWLISRHGEVSFSWSGRRVLFGTAPRVEELDEKSDDEDVPGVDIWHWNDPLLQSEQLAQIEEERKRSYQAIADVEMRRSVQLARLDMPEVKIGSRGDANVAVANSNYSYRKEHSWKHPDLFDAFLVSVETGKRTSIFRGRETRASLSPEAKYIFWWGREKAAWYVKSISGGEAIDISSSLPYSVVKKPHDWPYKPGSYGGAQWINGDKGMLLYDRHDIWLIDPTGSDPPKCITDGFGRENDLRFHYVRLDPDEITIDPEAPMLLSATNYKTKASGFYRDKIKGEKLPQKLKMMNRYFGKPKKAKKSKKILYTRESFREFPNLWVSTASFRKKTQVSDVNPQQKDYARGSAELVSWSDFEGETLNGLL
ncbi:MAG: hypothetical protein JKY51_09245, partial [Opitutaceae bacterium]|nr:hypothetical protein [Opitutaceae bacterium]